MTTIAILPIKTLDRAKQRLAAELDEMPRRALVEAMFSDALIALRRAQAIDAVLAVTPDHVAQRIAAGYGAEVIEDADTGHNDAARRGLERATALGADRALLVPGDCPLLDPEELDELATRRLRSRSVLVVPDRHGTGTNALLITPPDALEPSFGEGSHDRHLRQARDAGLTAESAPVASLALDVDTPEDLAVLTEALERSRGGAALTRGMLRQLVRSRG
ncbi:MAG TPA: 2-phospho-L-lactate guanylyltransferase [Solirubrobacteraceae bacterium]|nr:2-phospho-L-lactate guanylyltransferase [Solirubrobacteraceae bacterium]